MSRNRIRHAVLSGDYEKLSPSEVAVLLRNELQVSEEDKEFLFRLLSLLESEWEKINKIYPALDCDLVAYIVHRRLRTDVAGVLFKNLFKYAPKRVGMTCVRKGFLSTIHAKNREECLGQAVYCLRPAQRDWIELLRDITCQYVATLDVSRLSAMREAANLVRALATFEEAMTGSAPAARQIAKEFRIGQ